MLFYNHKPNTQIRAEYLVNAAGGSSMDIAHMMGTAETYTDLHFRGEYWQAPLQYQDLTKLSIYSVPRHPEFPFLDPHWIVRGDGKREVGPNAVPVFGPYAYGWRRNLADMLPKMIESSRTGARRIFLNRQFLSLASTELKSSLSKTAMINRVRDFLPQIRPLAFTQRGTAGIRSSSSTTGMLSRYLVYARRFRSLLNDTLPWATARCRGAIICKQSDVGMRAIPGRPMSCVGMQPPLPRK